jgi:hypothetical protein
VTPDAHASIMLTRRGRTDGERVRRVQRDVCSRRPAKLFVCRLTVPEVDMLGNSHRNRARLLGAGLPRPQPQKPRRSAGPNVTRPARRLAGAPRARDHTLLNSRPVCRSPPSTWRPTSFMPGPRPMAELHPHPETLDRGRLANQSRTHSAACVQGSELRTFAGVRFAEPEPEPEPGLSDRWPIRRQTLAYAPELPLRVREPVGWGSKSSRGCRAVARRLDEVFGR